MNPLQRTALLHEMSESDVMDFVKALQIDYVVEDEQLVRRHAQQAVEQWKALPWPTRVRD